MYFAEEMRSKGNFYIQTVDQKPTYLSWVGRYQLVCPNHMLNNPNTHQNCEKCLGGHFVNCMKGKCIHGSTAKSAIGMMEAEFWKWKSAYKYIDKVR